MDSVVIIGRLTIHDISFGETVGRILNAAADRSGAVVCTPNVDYVVRANRDEAFRRAVEAASLRVPDGMWIVYASRIAGRPLGGTVTGRLLVSAVAKKLATRRLTMALFGAGPSVAAIVAKRLRETTPGLTITAALTPPHPLEIGSAADRALVAELAASNPDVVFVALGAPRQEMWMVEHASSLNGAALVGVGAAFDILAGRFREAPPWMTRMGLEWLFRLAQEPRRLGRRYLIDDPWILWWALRTRILSS